MSLDVSGDPEARLRQGIEEEEAEEQRREENKDEAGRRQRVKRYLADWQRLHDILEPESAELEADECDAASRIEEGDTYEVALEREICRVVGKQKRLTPRSVALRISNAYDEEYAYILESLPSHAVSAERVYAHLLSYESVDRAIAPEALRSIARRATVLLLNRRFLARTATTRPAESPRPRPEPAPDPVGVREPELCLDCGRDVSLPGPGCEACEKTVS
jgi:hypothetical protein